MLRSVRKVVVVWYVCKSGFHLCGGVACMGLGVLLCGGVACMGSQVHLCGGGVACMGSRVHLCVVWHVWESGVPPVWWCVMYGIRQVRVPPRQGKTCSCVEVTWHGLLSLSRLKMTPTHWDGMRGAPWTGTQLERNLSHEAGRIRRGKIDYWQGTGKEVYPICLTKTTILITNMERKNLEGSCGVGLEMNASKWTQDFQCRQR